MAQEFPDKEHLLTRIQQLEHERDELRKDIEQLCMQQAGSSYLSVATRMHFQRTAGLEQEIENLKHKFAACTRENHNLQEELAEAYRIKSQLAELHSSEVTKNSESEKQLKFFQGCVAAAFAERDHSIMEAEKAKEKEDSMSQKLKEVQDRVEELSSDCCKLRESNDTLSINLAKQEEENEVSKQVINKFYEIREKYFEGFENTSWDEKCRCLLHDPPEMWSFNDNSTSRYINSLEEGLETMKKTVDNLQNKLRMDVEIEKHLKLKVNDLELKLIRMDDMVKSKISGFYQYYSQYRDHILNLLDKEKSNINSTIGEIEEKITLYGREFQNFKDSERELKADNDLPDEHLSINAKMNIPGLPDSVADENLEASGALALALQEKVSALLLLSQQEERHMLERDVNAALQRKTEELQRNLLQVTHEKVKVLMELAQVKQELQLLKDVHDQGADTVDRKVVTHEREGRLRGLLKGSYLRRWVGTPEISGSEAAAHLDNEENYSSRKSGVDFARMKIENATLRESIESIEHLTSSTHRLRLSLLKAKESVTSEGPATSVLEALKDIINEAKLIKTALSSSLPISWSGEVNTGSGRETLHDSSDVLGDSNLGKIDFVSAAGFEMVELLIFVAELLLKDHTAESGS
ncbi:putative ciliary rootlet coiled-coil protein 2 isoform X3 [Momordica charantia]|uniref:Ciliary rootlet coiled-coil protein 2 isoform X3 n=1 Tax=Momordica charantia TaxID=3673 RepID=A0A6J1D4Z4_MOMCH|nr:putative ciliary rootlet coiled-coil protein 2 isoform X3 [Momordica charantia]